MPQYELFFFQWQGHTSKMFIKNMPALPSEPGGRRKDKEEIMFVLNRDKKSLFTHRCDGYYN